MIWCTVYLVWWCSGSVCVGGLSTIYISLFSLSTSLQMMNIKTTTTASTSRVSSKSENDANKYYAKLSETRKHVDKHTRCIFEKDSVLLNFFCETSESTQNGKPYLAHGEKIGTWAWAWVWVWVVPCWNVP